MADDPNQKQEEIEEQVLDGEMDYTEGGFAPPGADKPLTGLARMAANRDQRAADAAEARARANSNQTDVTRKIFDRQPGTIAGEPRFQNDPGWVQPGGKRD